MLTKLGKPIAIIGNDKKQKNKKSKKMTDTKKVYFNKIQKTDDKTITKFYYNKNDKNYNNLDFLIAKIKNLIKSPKSTEGIKKQLNRLVDFDFAKYDCFYIYSNKLCFGINTTEKTVDFYDNDFDCVVKIAGYKNNYNCKLPKSTSGNSTKSNDNDTIDANDFVAPVDND